MKRYINLFEEFDDAESGRKTKSVDIEVLINDVIKKYNNTKCDIWCGFDSFTQEIFDVAVKMDLYNNETLTIHYGANYFEIYITDLISANLDYKLRNFISFNFTSKNGGLTLSFKHK